MSTEIVCPSCGKANQSTPCGRCGCELSTLFAVHRSAEVALAVAGGFLRSGNNQQAREHALRSWELHHTCAAARVVFLACIALNDLAWGQYWHHRAVMPQQSMPT